MPKLRCLVGVATSPSHRYGILGRRLGKRRVGSARVKFSGNNWQVDGGPHGVGHSSEALERRVLLSTLQLQSGEGYSGNFAAFGQQDTYTFAAAAGTDIEASMGLAGDSSIVPVIDLYAPNGNLLASEQSDFSSGGIALISEISAPTSGTYTLVASNDSAATGNYNISVATFPGTQSEDPLDNVGGPINSGQIASGYINGQLDAYSIVADAGGTIVVSMGSTDPSPGGFEPKIILFGPDGAFLDSDAANYDRGSAVVLDAVPVAGTYYVVAETANGLGGNYDLTIVSVPGPQVADSMDGAGGAITNGQDISGSLNGQIDAFSFTASGGATLGASVGTTDGGLSVVSPQVDLFDPTGSLLDSDNGNGSGGSFASVTATATIDGTYYVLVYGAVGYSLGSAEYDLTIQAPFSALPPPAGVQATDGTLVNDIQITWNDVAGATSYQVWRNTVSDSTTATEIAIGVTNLSYDDTSAIAGTAYYYWVVAVGASQTSGFSAPPADGLAAGGTDLGSNQLVFVQQPTDTFVGSNATNALASVDVTPAITVDVEDESGNIVTGDASSITLSIASGPIGAALTGEQTVQADDGVAVFSDISLSTPGTYTLSATDGGNGSATSASFTITTVLTLADLSQAAYSTTTATSDGYSMIPGGYNTDPNDPGYAAGAYANDANHNQIIIAFRGTVISLAAWPETISDVVADVSFDGSTPSSTLTSEVTDAITFVSELHHEFPTATLTLTGHSLGGAVAQLVGEASGLPAYGFNAPGAAQLYAGLSSSVLDFGVVAGLGSSGIDANYRLYGDQISLFGSPTGTTITIAAPSGTSFSSLPQPLSTLADLGTFYNLHIISTFISQLQMDPQVEADFPNGANSITIPGEPNDAHALQTSVPLTATSTPNGLVEGALSFDVSASLEALIDPSGGADFVLTEYAGSPSMSSIDLPALSDIGSYKVRFDAGGAWSPFQSISPATPDSFVRRGRCCRVSTARL